MHAFELFVIILYSLLMLQQATTYQLKETNKARDLCCFLYGWWQRLPSVRNQGIVSVNECGKTRNGPRLRPEKSDTSKGNFKEKETFGGARNRGFGMSVGNI